MAAMVGVRRAWKQRMAAWQRRWGTEVGLFLRQPLALIGLALIGVFGLMALAHPVLMATVWNRARFDPIVGYDASQTPHPHPPTPQHLLGTDGFGRDVLSQLLVGTRVSFGVGLIAAAVAVLLSVLLGGTAGYFGGWADAALMGVADVFVLMPPPVVLLIFGLLLRLNWPMVALSYGVLSGLGAQAVVVKSHTLVLRNRSFIEAARLAGGGHFHILRKHILPGLMPLLAAHAVFTVVGAVLTESLLSFFSRTTYYLSWGSMIWMGQQSFRWFTLEGQWHVILPPAFALMGFCSAFYLVGRALDEVFNPRLRRV
ncbi:MAG TPA: ABC transporter permease [Thermoflexia bacterium]|jgi:peptide/nickel transport system permease protein|nr:ABC transporter permease [Thermoflexia bacterium]